MEISGGENANPKEMGVYVAYINGPVMRYAERKLLFWDNNGWLYLGSDQRYRDTVYGWIGPLPAMPLV